MNIFFWIWVGILTTNVALVGIRHGQPEKGNFNVGIAFIDLIIEITLLYFAHFWFPISWQGIVTIILFAISLITYCIMHGKPRIGEYNFITTFIVTAIKVALVATGILSGVV